MKDDNDIAKDWIRSVFEVSKGNIEPSDFVDSIMDIMVEHKVKAKMGALVYIPYAFCVMAGILIGSAI